MLVKSFGQCLAVVRHLKCLLVSVVVVLLRFLGTFLVFPPGLTREPPGSTASMADGFRPSSSAGRVQASMPLVLAFEGLFCGVFCVSVFYFLCVWVYNCYLKTLSEHFVILSSAR